MGAHQVKDPKRPHQEKERLGKAVSDMTRDTLILAGDAKGYVRAPLVGALVLIVFGQS